MKSKLKYIYWLASVLIITTFAGCAYEDDHYHGGYGGYERGHGEFHHDGDFDHRDYDHGWDRR